ncbi:MAG: D-tyrosyl-tRNA(Tyr) deacylase [Bacteroidetes bacterium]|nr:D-tyrosyl-tRNA(Tyr) deacylase [Bacteroidota bacterium]MBS1683561.1 D-tyrosyl-tRNA(Tyr) deacylase [Bacteroidota bacterium]
MRLIIQRVSEASVTVDGHVKSAIGRGLLVLAGFEESDSVDDLEWTAAKLVNLRIFTDSEGLMNLAVKDVQGDIIVVSQFTLYAQTKKGNRPSFIRAAKPDIAIPLYEKFVFLVSKELGKSVGTGEFGADMKVALTNDGPVTIHIDSKNRE